MATKAKVFNDLVINAKEGLDVCIWKLMADRVGRTKSQIADELIPHGFNRKEVENRAESKMRGGWFERDEIKSKGITKYVLKRECRMPMPQVEEVVAANTDKPKRAPNPNKSAMQEALERAMTKKDEPKQAELPIEKPAVELGSPDTKPLNLYGDSKDYKPFPQLADGDGLVLAVTTSAPQPDLKNGLSSTIWDVMSDFREYTREEVILMLEALGANPSTVRLRFADLIRSDWFDERIEIKDGKKIPHYTLRTRAMRPLEEKPYRPQIKKQGETVNTDINPQGQNDKIDTSFNEQEIQKAIETVGEQLVPKAPYRLGTLRNILETAYNCTMTDGEVDKLVEILVEKNALVYVGNGTSDHMWMLPTVEIGVEVNTALTTTPNVSEDGIANALEEGDWTYFDAETTVKLTNAVGALMNDDGAYSKDAVAQMITDTLGQGVNVDAVIQLLVANNAIEKVVAGDDIKFSKVLSKEEVVKDENVPLKAADITELDLDMWTAIALDNGAAFETIREKLNHQGYDDAEIDATLEANKGVFYESQPGVFRLPLHLVTGTMTKDKIAMFKNRVGATNNKVKQGQQEMIKKAIEQAGTNAGTNIPPLQGYSISSALGAGVKPAIQPTDDTAGAFHAKDEQPKADHDLGLDYSLWKLLSDGAMRPLSGIVSALMLQGFAQEQVQNRVTQLTGWKMNVVETCPNLAGINFRLNKAAMEVKPGEKFRPVKPLDILNVKEGLMRCVYRLLRAGFVDRKEVIKQLTLVGFDEDFTIIELGRLTEEGLLSAVDANTLAFNEQNVVPPATVVTSTLDINDGIDRNIWLICSDRNAHRPDDIVAHLNKLGYRADRVQDHLARLMDKDGMLETGYWHNTKLVFLKPGAAAPERQAPHEEERRGPTPSSGFHSYMGEQKMPETPAPMFEFSCKVAGVPLQLKEVIALAHELRQLGFGQQGQQVKRSVLQTTHRINGKEVSEADLDRLSYELNSALFGTFAPGAWTDQQKTAEKNVDQFIGRWRS